MAQFKTLEPRAIVAEQTVLGANPQIAARLLRQGIDGHVCQTIRLAVITQWQLLANRGRRQENQPQHYDQSTTPAQTHHTVSYCHLRT
ncbi:hypothetical protein CAter10_2554 [Collimonas arenae]|nr:hypothetical protein CAter10_2554 [Collimonas arenae]